jgi:hypothetical protein
MIEREIHFYRCPGKAVAFETVISNGTLYQLDKHGMCPLCGTPVAEHTSFTLRAKSDGPQVDADAA